MLRKPQPVNSEIANRTPLLAIGMLVAFSGVRVKPKLEQKSSGLLLETKLREKLEDVNHG
jgi:hypothetical protein